MKKNYENAVNVIIHVHQFRLILTLITLDQLISNKIYSLLTSKVLKKPSPNIYFENIFNENDAD